MKKQESTFLYNVGKLVTGTAVTQVVSLAAAPILTRAYGPEAFGILAIFTAITGILASIVCFRYEHAIVIPKTDRLAQNVLALCIISTAIFSILLIVILLVGQWENLKGTNLYPLVDYKWMIPFCVFLSGMTTSISYYYTRKKSFGEISLSQVFSGLTTTGTSLIFCMISYVSGAALITANVLGKMVMFVFMLNQREKILDKLWHKSVTCRRILFVAKRYRSFPIYGCWSILLGNGAWLLPIILMGWFFSATFVGLYALGFKLLQIPVNLVGSAIGQVFLNISAESVHDDSLKGKVEKLYGCMISISALPFFLLVFIGGDLYAVIFGEEWYEAGYYTQILSLWALVWFLSAPFTGLFSVLGEQKLQLKWNVVNFVTRIGCVFLGVYLESAELVVWMLGVSGFIIYFFKIYLIFCISKSDVKYMVYSSFKCAFVACILAYVAVFFAGDIGLVSILFFLIIVLVNIYINSYKFKSISF